jgi:hypothetical protein
VKEGLSPFFLASLMAAIAIFLFACSSTVSEIETGDDHRRMSQDEFVASIKQMADDQITLEDVMHDVEKVRGKVVKWNGDIIKYWSDKLLIASQGTADHWNHFILLLDHPLPEQSSVADLKQTVSTRDAIFALGRIINRQTIVLETGSDLTIPHLECYVISKDNDRQFAKPVWVINR